MQYKINLRTALLTLALVAIAGIPVTAWALGLGQLKSDTRIGQPFSARIPITGASAGVIQGLHVELASPEAYKSANLSVPDYLYSLKFNVEQGSNGAYIKVSSDKPVKLPFLNLLINARWNSGQVTRQYTVLLNPPVFVSGEKSQQPVEAPSSPSQKQQPVSSKAPAPQPAPEQQQPAEGQQAKPAPHPTPQPVQQTQQTQQTQTSPASSPSTPAYPKEQETPSGAPSSYTVQHGDTLWGLSRRMRPSGSVSVNRMMIAVYRANPHAFRGNINRLKSGAVLQMPSQSQIAQITAEEATRIVARQNNEWQGGQVAANGKAPAKAGNGSAAGETAESQSAGGQVASESQSGASEQPVPAATAGRVVLTTPEVTASNSVAAAPGSAVSGTSSSAAMAGAVSGTSAVAAGAGAASAEASSQRPAGSAEQAGTGASAGGPLKVQSNAMAGLAGAGKAGNTAGTSAGAEAATTATAKNSQPAAQQQAKNAANNANSVNSVSTAGSEETEGGSGLMYWIKQPSGWIVIGAVVLLLAALLLVIAKRRKSNSGSVGQAEVAGQGPSESDDGSDAGPEASGNIKAGIPHETESGIANVAAKAESSGHEDGDELGIATYIGGPSLDVNKVDAIDEADLHVGFGDYNKAAEVLRAAIDRDPSRAELRKKLLDVLFAAGDAAGFANEAAVYRDQVDAAAWEEAAVMGRQLLPEEPLFASGQGSAEVAVAEETQGAAPAGDYLDIDLDRLSPDTESQSDQSEFERTMDELSTFIETYVPASSETPVSLQLPPEENEVAEKPKADSQADVPDDEPLEFTLDEDDLPAPRENDLDLAFEEGDESGDENLVDTKLDLARAYIDMGDGDSARSVLEEVIDEGDETQSGEAKRLLETLG